MQLCSRAYAPCNHCLTEPRVRRRSRLTRMTRMPASAHGPRHGPPQLLRCRMHCDGCGRTSRPTTDPTRAMPSGSSRCSTAPQLMDSGQHRRPTSRLHAHTSTGTSPPIGTGRPVLGTALSSAAAILGTAPIGHQRRPSARGGVVALPSSYAPSPPPPQRGSPIPGVRSPPCGEDPPRSHVARARARGRSHGRLMGRSPLE